MALDDIPNAVKAGGIVGMVVVTLGSIMAFAGQNLTFILVVLAGLVFLGLILLAYWLLLKWLDKRKAQKMETGLAKDAANRPNAVSDPKKLADIESMRREFLRGIEVFHSRGKDIYSLPWYIVVGESGSGKTEAIRRSGVGFPDGLQDRMQGVGGTLNMHWWFTNHSVILDTAGRFLDMREENLAEFRKFLELIGKYRRKCPANGIVMVISADDLIGKGNDSVTYLGQKAATLLGTIQAGLGVRVPVFVLVTKADKIAGFEEYFSQLRDPILQQQIMGWSKPGSLDEPFKPEWVDQAIASMKDRLMARRGKMMLESGRDEPTGSRLDEVDALFGFPQSLAAIGPRLRRYLEPLFMPNAWTSKPLFFRGIYFTSALTEGKTLDEAVAEAMGIDVDSLPTSGRFRQEKPYFLRDVFVEKIFKERALVTRADNTRQLRRRRSVAVLACLFLMLLLLAGSGAYYAHQFHKSIGSHRRYWDAAVKGELWKDQPIVDKNGYTGTLQIPFEDQSPPPTKAQVRAEGSKLAKSRIETPMIFRPFTVVGGELSGDAQAAHRVVFEATVVRPLVLESLKKLREAEKTPSGGDDAARDAAAVLLAFENGSTQPRPDGLDSLARLVLSEEQLKDYEKESPIVQDLLRTLYSGKTSWPPVAAKWVDLPLPAGADGDKTGGSGGDAMVAYVRGLVDRWKVRSSGPDASNAFFQAVANYQRAEKAILSWNPPGDKSTPAERIKDWNVRANTYDKAATTLNNLLNSGHTADYYLDEARKQKKKQWSAVYAALHDATGTSDKLVLQTVRINLEQADKTIDRQLAEGEGWKIPPELGSLKAERLQEILGAVQHAAEACKASDHSAASFLTLQNRLKEIQTASDSDTNYFKKYESNSGGVTGKAWEACLMARALQKRNAIEAALRDGPKTEEAVEKLVAGVVKDGKLAGEKVAPLGRDKIPLTKSGDGLFKDAFHPDVAAKLTQVWTEVNQTLPGDGVPAEALSDDAASQRKSISTAMDSYRQKYFDYWSSVIGRDFLSSSADLAELAKAMEPDVLEQLETLGKQVKISLGAVPTLDRNAPPPGLKNADNGLKSLASDQYKDEREKVLAKWHALINERLDADAFAQATRLAILARTRADVKTDYWLSTPPSAEGNFVRAYYSNICLRALTIAADKSQDSLQVHIDRLKPLLRFPLAPADVKKSDLADKELADAVVELDAILVATAKPVSDAKADDAALPRDLAELIGRLKGDVVLVNNSLNRSDLESASVLAHAIKEATNAKKGIKGTITFVVDPKIEADHDLSAKYHFFEIARKKQVQQHWNMAALNGKTVDLFVPDVDTGIELRLVRLIDNQKEVVSAATAFGGRWSLLKILSQPQDGNSYILDFVDSIDASSRKLRIQIKTDSELGTLSHLKNKN